MANRNRTHVTNQGRQNPASPKSGGGSITVSHLVGAVLLTVAVLLVGMLSGHAIGADSDAFLRVCWSAAAVFGGLGVVFVSGSLASRLLPSILRRLLFPGE